ncbi:putative sigma-54 modulation protein [Parelusimicrobium proximum]|uniref:ribosome hibernation-promoting factor, HPF/YfiA family n=1 Tax=Parelusimicrobium proximum TaxID=3228953 RepID=UPI003D1649FC
MDIQITAKNIKLTAAIKSYVEEKVGKIEKHFDNVVWAQVILSVEKKINQKAEVFIHAGKKQIIKASAVEADLYKAIDEAVFKAEAQIKKTKEKKISKRVKKEQKSWKDIPYMDVVLAPQADVRFSVIKQVEVRPMNPEDAAYEMERIGYTFWMFLDQDSKDLNLIFKRLDGTYGLIKPIRKK